jgi:hypothetical protein
MAPAGIIRLVAVLITGFDPMAIQCGLTALNTTTVVDGMAVLVVGALISVLKCCERLALIKFIVVSLGC